MKIETIFSLHDHILLLATRLRVILTLLALDDKQLVLGQLAIDFEKLTEQPLEHLRLDLVLNVSLGLGFQKVLRNPFVPGKELVRWSRIGSIPAEADLGKRLGVEIRFDALNGRAIPT